jgi:tRNA A-37 threonylcarbamoyl transferase component Bud32
MAFLFMLLVAGVGVLVILLNSRARRRSVPVLERAAPPGAATRRAARPTALQSCPECGAALSPEAPEGMCPQCLLRGAIGGAHEKARSAPGEATGPFPGPAAPAVTQLAELFPQLKILELIGQGGMGAVYKARQPSLDRLVAVKVLPPEAGRDPAFAERFNREARALARLSHPNIVAVHDVGQAGDYYYFVMEYIDGVNLRQLLRDGHLPPEQALRIVPQICDALQYAHEEGVVHRDIKPENILLDKKGRVKIADFGLAKLLGRDTDNFTLTGSRQVMGTLYYMAPEQVERPLTVDHRADIYSLGVVFYEMLTGQLPVGRFPLPSEKVGTDPHLDGVVLHALEREPERRYQHASDVKTDVESGARAAPSLARKTDVSNRELALHQLKGPAIGLMAIALVGIIACALMVVASIMEHGGWDTSKGSDLVDWLIALVVSTIGGVLLIAGAWKMKRLEAYEFSFIAAVLAVLPVTMVAWPISVVIGVWALVILSKAEVRAAFKEQLERSLRTPVPTAQRTTLAPDGLPEPAALPGAVKRELAVRQLKGPALGLIVMGILGPLEWLALFLIYVLMLWWDSKGRMGGDSWFWTGLDKGYGPFLILFLVNLVIGGFLIAGARKMKRLEAYEFSIICCLMTLLQLATPTFLVSFIVGAWALWIMRKPEVRAAFKEELERSLHNPASTALGTTAAPDDVPESAPLSGVRARVQAPSRALLTTGIVYSSVTLLAAPIAALTFLYLNPPAPATNDAWMWGLLVGFALIAQGPIIIMGALKMRHLESYGWAVAGGIVALVPATPLAVFGMPTGVWALAVLTAPEVKAAFPPSAEHPSAV